METSIILTLLIISFAFFGEAIFGFGAALIAIPLLSLVLGIKDAVAVVLIFQLLIGILILKTYKFIDWSTARPMSYAIIIGTIIGTLLLSSSSPAFLQIFLAIMITLFLIKSAFFNSITLGRRKNTLSASAAGLSGGLIQGLIGTGGPILTMYVSVATKKKISIRATLIYLLFVTSVVRVLISLPQQLFNDRVVQLSLISFPFFIAAIFIGQHLHHKINEKYYRLSINIILGISALALILKAIH